MPEKDRDSGVVSWNVFDAVCEHQTSLYRKLRFSIKAGDALDEERTALDIISDLLDQNEEELQELRKKGLAERGGGGLPQMEPEAQEQEVAFEYDHLNGEDRAVLDRLLTIRRQGGESWENLKAMIEGVHATLHRRERSGAEPAANTESSQEPGSRVDETRPPSLWKGKLLGLLALVISAVALSGIFYHQMAPPSPKSHLPQAISPVEPGSPNGNALSPESRCPAISQPERLPPPPPPESPGGADSLSRADEGLMPEKAPLPDSPSSETVESRNHHGEQDLPEILKDRRENAGLQEETAEESGNGSASETAAENKSTAFLPNPARGHLFEVTASEESWIKVAIDDGKPESHLLKPGEKKEWEVSRRAKVTLGNAGGAQLKWNGKVIEMGSKPGRVLRFQLPDVLSTQKS